MAGDDPRAFLLQSDLRDWFEHRVGREPWVTVYQWTQTREEHGAIFSALVPLAGVPRVLERASWELGIGDGRPCCAQSGPEGARVTEYLRFGDDNGIEPLVFVREFHALRPRTIELLEEFRHFHNLFHDQDRGEYLRFDEDGNEEVVAKVEQHRVDVLLRPLRQFVALKQMALVVYLDVARFAEATVDVVEPAGRHASVQTSSLAYTIDVGEYDGLMHREQHSLSRLLGKRVVPPLPVEECGMWPYKTERRRYCEFIIGRDEHGEEVTHSCDPELLANYFGKNPRAPHFLTPVHFRPEVLKKYFDQPDRFEVRDGILYCGSLWSLRLDNDHASRVIVFLGDLGETLGYREQQHWQHHNLPPEGDLSAVARRREFDAEFADPERADLRFRAGVPAVHRRVDTRRRLAAVSPAREGR